MIVTNTSTCMVMAIVCVKEEGRERGGLLSIQRSSFVGNCVDRD